MANHKSALKRIRQTTTRTKQNRANKAELKKALKVVVNAIEKKSKDSNEMMSKAASALAKAARKGAINKVKAARKTSRLQKALNRASS